MKALLTGISAVMILIGAGCASSQEEEIPAEEQLQNVIAPNPPEDNSYDSSSVYIDSVGTILRDGERVPVIFGSFPDGCTQLKSAEYRTENDSLHVILSAWRDPDLMCAQVLTSFSFVYDDLKQEINNRTAIIINGTGYNIR